LPRVAREKSSTGIYHIMLRGINRQDIFEDDEDRERFIGTILRYKKEIGFQLYAYCLMNNHVHLIIRENDMELSKTMKRIGTSYASYFNYKYGRSGHLFQDRYNSEAVENDSYLYLVIRYIHQNPVKAGICSMEDYKWSSYNCYLDEGSTIDKDLFLDIFDSDRKLAIDKYIALMNEPNNDICMELSNRVRLTDEKVREMIKVFGELDSISDMHSLDEKRRVEILRNLKEIQGVSVLQISRVTGIHRTKINKL